MANIMTKLHAAQRAAAANPAIKAAHPKFMKMDRERLYAVLEGAGYRWDPVTQQWTPRQLMAINGAPTKDRMTAAQPRLNNVFLVRIMASRDEISKVQSEFLELAEALGWHVEHKEAEYPNDPDGAWVRRYYTVKRGN
jgi:hypothetical protein